MHLSNEILAGLTEGNLTVTELADVQVHLDDCDGCREVLSELARTWGEVPPSEHPARTALRRGDVVERYVVLKLLGVGGMARVFLAFDPRLMREVALKLLNLNAADLETKALSDLVAREARAMARVAHPNTLAVYEVGYFGERMFIAMEYAKGETLARWLNAAPRRWREVVRTFAAAGEGLAAAHRAGVVHRDFKPDNVIVSPDGRVRVTDFGLARFELPTAPGPGHPEGATTNPVLQISRTGALLGTPAYMSAEQFRGEPANERSDQFSFAVALYRALTHVAPFSGEDLTSLRAEVEQGRLRPFPSGSPVPGFVRRAVLRALSLDPGARFPSMESLLAELSRDPRRRWRVAGTVALAGAALVAVPLSSKALELERHRGCANLAESRISHSWNPTAVAQLKAAFTAEGGAPAFQGWRATQTVLDAYAARWRNVSTGTCLARHSANAVDEKLLTLQQDCLDQQLTNFKVLVELLSDTSPRVVQNARAAASGLPQVEACEDVSQSLNLEPLPTALERRKEAEQSRMFVARARALEDLGNYPKALEAAAQAKTLALDSGHVPTLAASLYTLGFLQDGDAQMSAGATMNEAAMQALRGHDDVLLASSWLASASFLAHEHQLEAAQRTLADAEALISRLHRPRLDERLATTQAMVASGAGDLQASLRANERAIAVSEHLDGKDNPRLALILYNYSIVLLKAGQLLPAERAAQRSAELYAHAYGESSPDVADALEMVAGIHQALGAFGKLVQEFERVLAMRSQSLRAGHPLVLRARANLATAEVLTGRVEQGLGDMAEVLELASPKGAMEPVDLAELYSAAAELELGAGHPEKALGHFRAAHAHLQSAGEAKHPSTRLALAGEARALLAKGDARSDRTMVETLSAARDLGPPVERGENRFALARVLMATGGAAERKRAEAAAKSAAQDFTAAGPGSDARRVAVETWTQRAFPRR